jgi:hypothetical protein
MKKYLFLILLAAASCAPKNPGYITLVNSDVQKLKIYIDRRNFTLFPSNHITKQVSAGKHKIRIDGGLPIKIQVDKGKTVVFDSSGLSCFVVADFSGRASGGEIKIAERFFHQQVFQTSYEMITILGAPLPKTIKGDKPAFRLHQTDCEIVNNNEALISELKALP